MAMFLEYIKAKDFLLPNYHPKVTTLNTIKASKQCISNDSEVVVLT